MSHRTRYTIHHTPYTEHCTLSVVLATRNEEANIRRVIASVQDLADEIIVVDEGSTDKTRSIAKELGAKVFKVKHEPIFHKTKQKALAKAKGDWILQLDADEVVTSGLAEEIKSVLEGRHKRGGGDKNKLFLRHQKLLESRDGKLGKDTGEIVAYFIPRRNYFLGKPLIHAGVYPDAVIRLVKKGKARFPGESVHEQIEVDGNVAWLFNDLKHNDSPTLRRYIARMNRYTDLQSEEFEAKKLSKNFFTLFLYTTFLPFINFLKLYFRHKGFLDGMRGFLWSLLSSLHFPLAYYKYQTR